MLLWVGAVDTVSFPALISWRLVQVSVPVAP